MLHLRSSITILFILVAVVTAAVPYSEWKRAYQHGSNDHFTVKRQTAIRQALLETSACATITETRGEKSYKVRICTADPEGIAHSLLTCIKLIGRYLSPS